jgi:hypothetical protein
MALVTTFATAPILDAIRRGREDALWKPEARA